MNPAPVDIIPAQTPSVPAKADYRTLMLEAAREKLTRYLPRAVEIITELAETSENDRVRLAAAQDIADRAGLGKSSTVGVQVTSTEHDTARREAEDVVARIRENQALKPAPHISIDALVVHEGVLADS